jgi:hypothetical protein
MSTSGGKLQPGRSQCTCPSKRGNVSELLHQLQAGQRPGSLYGIGYSSVLPGKPLFAVRVLSLLVLSIDYSRAICSRTSAPHAFIAKLTATQTSERCRRYTRGYDRHGQGSARRRASLSQYRSAHH